MEQFDQERDIIERLKNDDGKAMVPLFKLYHKGLVYFARQIVKSTEQAEDIVAETFIKVWRQRATFEAFDNIRAFMHVAVRNACLDYLKHVRRKSASHKEILHLAEKDHNYLESKLIKSQLLQMVFEEVELLPPIRRKIFKMMYLDGLSTFEIARILNISPDTVRVQKARAIHSLRSNFLKKGMMIDFSLMGAGLYFIYFL